MFKHRAIVGAPPDIADTQFERVLRPKKQPIFGIVTFLFASATQK